MSLPRGPLELLLRVSVDLDTLTITAPAGYFSGDIPTALRHLAADCERNPPPESRECDCITCQSRIIPARAYATLTEHNELEGETWRFYIPAQGNEGAPRELEPAIAAILDDTGEPVYELRLSPALTEAQVDTLAEFSDEGYMRYHNKLDGLLILTPESIVKIKGGDNLLYKGGIRDLMNPLF